MGEALDQGCALVTGAARRLGRAIALALAQKNLSVALHASQRSRAEADEVCAAIRAAGGRACVLTADLADQQAVAGLMAAAHALPQDLVLSCVLSGGDDYELLFTAPPSARAAVQAAAVSSHTPVTRIGTVEATPGLRLLDAQGQELGGADKYKSFDHFSNQSV
jgi:thiamine-monophosphate kinase